MECMKIRTDEQIEILWLIEHCDSCSYDSLAIISFNSHSLSKIFFKKNCDLLVTIPFPTLTNKCTPLTRTDF
jgi:hypothetical protein